MKPTPVVLAALAAAGGALAQSAGRPAEPPVATQALAVAVQSPNALWVTRVYQDLLGRAPDSAGLKTFVTELDKGTPRSQVATQVVSSAEYRSRVVKDLYSLYLHRAPDPGAAAFWTGRLGSVGYLGVQKEILASPEYLASRGGGSVDKFLDALYQDVLGRPADPAAHANLLKLFGGGGLSQKSLVEALVGSGEGRAALVKQLSQRLFRRAPDPSTASFFASQLGAGSSEENVLVEMLASAEYFQRRP